MATLVPKYDRLLGVYREDDTSGEVPSTRTLTLTGTTNQVVVSPTGAQDLSADRSWTLSLPQSIATTSTPTFSSLTLTNPLTVPNGGTGLSTLTVNRIPYGNGTSAFQSSASLTFDGTNLNINGSTSAGLSVNGYTKIGDTNSQVTPSTGSGMGVLWNYSGGSAEMALFNLFNTGGGFTGGFRFFQGNASNAYGEIGWLKWNGGNTNLYLGAGSSPGITFNDTTFSRDGTTSMALGGRLGVGYSTSTDASVSSLQNGVTANITGTSASRFWGSIGGAITQSSANYTDSWCVNGFEGNAGHNGTGTNAGANGLLFYIYNLNTGTLGTARAIHLITGVNSGGGHITEYFNIQTEGLPAYSANNQNRAQIQFNGTMPSVGGFTGTKTATIWFNYDTTTGTNGIAFGTALDTLLFRGAAGQVNITSSLLVSGLTLGSVLFAGTGGLVSQNNSQYFWDNTNIMLGINATTSPSAHLHVIGVTPAVAATGVNASFGAKIIGGTGGEANSKFGVAGNGGAILLQGGPGGSNTAGSSGTGGNGADVKINAGVFGTGNAANGTTGSVYFYKSNGSTKLQQFNDTGIGFFAAAPVAQQTGDIGTGLVNLGLFSSTTSTANVVASGRQTAQTAADANIVTFTTPAADHSYLISTNALVTASTLHSFTTTCSYTDESNTARVLTLNYSQLTGAFITAITNGTGASSYEGVPVQIRVKASTNIVLATTGTFTSVTYNIEGVITQVT